MQEYVILLKDTNYNREEFKAELSKISGFPINYFSGIFGSGTNGFNWINSMSDMRKISKKYNNRVIALQYIGNKVSETYREYYLNGRVQVVPVRMSFDAFDERFLD